MNNEEIMQNSIVTVKNMFRKYSSEHMIDSVLCASSGFEMDEDDKDYFCPLCTDCNNPWLLHVKVSQNVSISLICEQVGFNFYRIKDIWIKDQVSFWSARLELLQYVLHHTAGGLVYILPEDNRPIWEVVTDDVVRDEFTDNLISLVDQMARRPSRYNEQ